MSPDVKFEHVPQWCGHAPSIERLGLAPATDPIPSLGGAVPESRVHGQFAIELITVDSIVNAQVRPARDRTGGFEGDFVYTPLMSTFVEFDQSIVIQASDGNPIESPQRHALDVHGLGVDCGLRRNPKTRPKLSPIDLGFRLSG